VRRLEGGGVQHPVGMRASSTIGTNSKTDP
jgi:hypothetical protein